MQDESNKPRRKKERHGTSRQRRNASTEIYTIVCNALNQYPNKALGELAEMLSVEHAENHTLVSLAFHRFWLAAIRGVSEEDDTWWEQVPRTRASD